MRRAKKQYNRPRRFWWLAIIIPLLAGIGVGIYISIVSDLPPVESISFFTPPVATKVYDNNNNLITEFFVERRELTNIDKIPSYLKEGLICIEDRSFYSHWGIDILALARSLITNILHMKIVQGGSTLTMQLARNMFLTLEQTYVRKLKEMVLAIRIERVYTKDEILEKYLNQIYFGRGRYGVATAARYYFDKDVPELSLAECALLIGIAKSPGRYSPHKHPEKAKSRRNLVLRQMFKSHLMTEAEYEEETNQSLNVIEYKENKLIGKYFLEEIRKYLELKYGAEFLYRSGANIYTTMDTEMQKLAEEVLEKHLVQIEKDFKFKNSKSKFDSLGLSDTLKASPYLQGALVFMDQHTGEVKALIGGRDFVQNKFNRATQAHRQAGSAFKIFVFTTAIDNGFTPADIVLDLPIVLEIPGVDSIYRPANYDRRFLGPITVRKAFALSRNLVAIRLIRNIGPELVVKYSHSLGVESPLLPVVSLALGVCGVSLLELTSSVGTIANLGEKVEPILIRKITNREGTVIEMNNPVPERRLSPKTSYIMINMMRAVVNGGTGYRVKKYYQGSAAGKTGTTNNYSDAWFVGFTPKYVCGVWVGYDNNDRIFRGATGGRVSAPIWADLMAKIDTLPNAEFPKPTGLITRTICSQTGLLATEFCPHPRKEVFIYGTQPTDSCDLHGFKDEIDYQDDFEKIDQSILEEY